MSYITSNLIKLQRGCCRFSSVRFNQSKTASGIIANESPSKNHDSWFEKLKHHMGTGDADKLTLPDNVTYIDAEPIKTGREGKVIDAHSDSQACVLCRLNLKTLNYTDVMIISQFIKRDGSLATFQESKLCSKQYHKICRLIKQAQRCNLIQRSPDYLVPGPWHDLNTYIEKDRRRDQPMKIIKKQYWKM